MKMKRTVAIYKNNKNNTEKVEQQKITKGKDTEI